MLNYNGYYNPMMNAQQRLNQLENQYTQFSQPQQQVMRVIPVTNVEEANATQVDVQGTPTFFYNQAKNEIYLKRVNLNTGLADFLKFELTQQPTTNEKEAPSINTYEKGLNAIMGKLDTLQATLQNLNKKEVEKDTKGTKNVKL